MKIIKEIDVSHMAVARSQIDCFHDGPPELKLGLGNDGELYARGQYSGWSFRNTWQMVGNKNSPSFSFNEMKEIINKILKIDSKTLKLMCRTGEGDSVEFSVDNRFKGEEYCIETETKNGTQISIILNKDDKQEIISFLSRV